LSKLGLKPVEAGLTMKAVYDDGLIIIGEQMRQNLEEIRQRVEEAHAFALNLSLNSAFPTPENVTLLLQAGRHEAYALAMNGGVPTSDTIANLMRKAHMEMLSLRSKLKGNSE